ncbi:MAG: hypothetical protein V4487_01425 [Chlamydiota bacterium]
MFSFFGSNLSPVSEPPSEVCAVCAYPLNNGEPVYGHVVVISERTDPKTGKILQTAREMMDQHLSHKECWEGWLCEKWECHTCKIAIYGDSMVPHTEKLNRFIKRIILKLPGREGVIAAAKNVKAIAIATTVGVLLVGSLAMTGLAAQAVGMKTETGIGVGTTLLAVAGIGGVLMAVEGGIENQGR